MRADPIGRVCLAAGVAAWLGVATAHLGPPPLGSALAVTAVGAGVVAVAVRSRAIGVVVAVLCAGLLVGWGQRLADDATVSALAHDPGGATTITGTLSADGRARRPPAGGWYATIEPETRLGAPWRGPRLLLSAPDGDPWPVGSTVSVRGRLDPRPATVAGRPVAGVLVAEEVAEVGRPPVVFRFADALRARIHDTYGTIDGPGADLVVGFLVGDIDDLSPVVAEELRWAGLSHYVAVSGSNVALFLVGWWVVTLPLSLHPATRWAVGLAGLAFFVIVTRWEPSVVRASVMAGMFLVARRAGIVLSGPAVLGLAVAATLLVVPSFATNLGFQLSVAATGGLLAGFSSGRRGGVAGALRATVSAQVAVAPLLLARVGSVPLVSPLANLVAAPLVSAATVAGAFGAVLGWEPVARSAAALAGLVAVVGRAAAPFPVLGWWGFAGVVGLALGWRVRRLRPWVGVAVVVVVAVGSFSAAVGRPGAWVAFLDVGQGDAAIVRGPDGETILVDGGPDPVVLAAALRRHGIRRIDLLVVSHRHADHAVGLEAVVGRLPVGEVWHPAHREWGALGPILDAIDAVGIARRTPEPGEVVALGSVRLEVLGPVRRYVSPNDESLVVKVTVGEAAVLFSGDIEVPAQHDLGPLPSVVLKVPHQGAATSDAGWLAASAGRVAVVSVGPNQFGHPVPWVLEALEAAGALVCRTDRGGDVVIDVAGSEPVVRSGCHSGRRDDSVHSPGS